MANKRIYDLDAVTLADTFTIPVDDVSLSETQQTTVKDLADYILAKFNTSAVKLTTVEVTGNYTVLGSCNLFVNLAADGQIDLPLASDAGVIVVIHTKALGRYTLTIHPQSGETINGLSSDSTETDDAKTYWFTSDGVDNWSCLNN